MNIKFNEQVIQEEIEKLKELNEKCRIRSISIEESIQQSKGKAANAAEKNASYVLALDGTLSEMIDATINVLTHAKEGFINAEENASNNYKNLMNYVGGGK